jgi:DNA mismatch endonuclease, patch repair protein
LVVVADYPHPSSAGRSANMRANRRTDTKPELALRRALHRLGYRYRKDYRLDLDGGRRVRPDIAFTARKVAIFVDGCFWHACPQHGSKPRANEWYWGPKLLANVERDRVNDAALTTAGWTVIRLWEHLSLEEAVTTVETALAAETPKTPKTPKIPKIPKTPNTPNAPKIPKTPKPRRQTARQTATRLADVPGPSVWQTLGHHARLLALDPARPGAGPADRAPRPGRGGPGTRVRGHARVA